MARIHMVAVISVAINLAVHISAFAEESCSPDVGRHTFETKCAMCHSIDRAKGTIVGPNLFGIVGRPIGKLPGFGYSKALADSTEKWDEKELDLFLKAPMAYKPGTAMPFSGIKKEIERASTICYLRQQR
jgi:cytochrome c